MNHHHLKYRYKDLQHGIAVISAMLLAALTTIIVGQLVWDQQLLISELENQQNATQAAIVADAAVQWSRAILAEDAKTSSIDHNKEVWATKLPLTSIEGGKVSGFITDQQQYFNLNNLASESSAQTGFNRLITNLGLNANLTYAVIDWIDADDITNGADGAENSYYLSLPQPYLSANSTLIEIGNLIRIKGFEPSSINKIAPFVTVLPTNTEINVNTASAEVLSFALSDINLQEAQAIIAARNTGVFKDINEFKTRLPAGVDVSNVNLSVNSHYFLVTCIAQFGRTTLTLESLLYRDDKGWPVILWKRRI